MWYVDDYFTHNVNVHNKCIKVPLGIILKDESKREDMVAIVSEAHHFVESTTIETIQSTGEEVPITSAVFHHVFLGGNQLE